MQAIFKKTPHDKQVMMFSATLSADIRPVCKKFMRDVRAFLLGFNNLHSPRTCPAPTQPPPSACPAAATVCRPMRRSRVLRRSARCR